MDATPDDIADTGLPVHRYLSRKLDEHAELTNVEVARRLGYERANVIAMMRTGSMKVPLNKVPDLARLIGVDPRALLRRVLLEYDPALWKTVQCIFGTGTLSANEQALIDLLRSRTAALDPDLAGNQVFALGFTLLVDQVVDEHTLAELANSNKPPGRRVVTAIAADQKLEVLAERQAQERIALRRRLLADGKPRQGPAR